MSIKLSKKHGVNPAIPVCFLCGEDKNEVILAGRLPGDEEAPRGVAWDKEPCDKCKEHQKLGVILISVKDGEEGSNNPYRTGGWVVIKDEALERFVTPRELLDDILKQRVAFLPDEAWDLIGLPRE